MDGGVRWEPALDEKQTTGRWLICADAFTPVVIEAAGKSRFSSLEEFRQAVMAAEQRLDGATYTYTSRVYDTTLALCTDYSRSPEIDGQPVDYRPAMAIDSPFLRIPYGGTTAELTGLGGEQVRYDFSGVGGP